MRCSTLGLAMTSEIDVDTGGNNFTIELGSGLNVIDIDAVQSAKQITVKDFSSDDVIDVSDWMTFTADATAHERYRRPRQRW